MTDQRLSRRSLLFGATAVGMGALLAACSQAPPATPTVAPAAPAPRPTAAAQPTAAAKANPTPVSAPQATKQIPRSQTLILSESDAVNQFTDVEIMNPYLNGIARSGWQFAFEPLYFYNTYYTDQVCGPPGMPCKDGEIPWQATSYAYSDDSTQLVIKLRSDVTWSDGEPFTANDVAFTLNMLKDNAPKLTWSSDMQQWIKEAVALDDHTAQITLTAPNPRFMFDYLMVHYDQGLVMLPEHIFKGQDPTTFNNFDLSKKWPIVTGPWQLTLSNLEQKFWDRRDDWWAAKAGFHPLPKMLRIIDLPSYEDTKRAELLISNQVDAVHNMQPANALAALAKNPKLEMWTPNAPYGLIDFTTDGMFFNCSQPPYNDPDIRWAINHGINRDQVVKVGYHGNGVTATLPLPGFPSMKPYYDSVSDILQKFPIDDLDPNKTAQIMQSKGYQKDQGGFWAKGGKRFPLVIVIPPSLFGDITPVIVEQLRKVGFDASFKALSNYGTIEATGSENAYLTTFGGSVRDPYFNLSFFQSKYSAPTGQAAIQPYRWKNSEFDKAIAEMGPIASSDPKFMSLYHQAMELWISDLPGIPIVQNFVMLPVNTTYWKNWPNAKNPYIIPSNWHRTAGLFINTLEPANS